MELTQDQLNARRSDKSREGTARKPKENAALTNAKRSNMLAGFVVLKIDKRSNMLAGFADSNETLRKIECDGPEEAMRLYQSLKKHLRRTPEKYVDVKVSKRGTDIYLAKGEGAMASVPPSRSRTEKQVPAKEELWMFEEIKVSELAAAKAARSAVRRGRREQSGASREQRKTRPIDNKSPDGRRETRMSN